MSYRIYRTEAVVLKSYPSGEADRMLTLYTEEFGLIYAKAQGVRHEKSKLRYALTDLSYTTIALVRGKAGWRVTGASAGTPAIASRRALIALARIALLSTRLVQGEDKNDYLFATLRSAHELLRAGEDPELIEVISVSRMLHALGYVAPSALDGDIFTERAYEKASLEKTKDAMPSLVRRINETLTVTHL